MADQRYKAVAVYEDNIRAPDVQAKIIEKDMPRPGKGEALVRIFLRPVSAAYHRRPARSRGYLKVLSA